MTDDTVTDFRRQWWWTPVAIAAVVLLGFIVLFGAGRSARDEQQDRRDLVTGCIAIGGDPQYIADEDGWITDYLGCVTP